MHQIRREEQELTELYHAANVSSDIKANWFLFDQMI